ncbi:glycoside hydrolase family 16 protein [Umezawaea sp. Da 62-37]|uniref:glycoside hydrolase family 16 protein n=1 Tax=Umezawaea sp. Da 62-37 TaxID=3075927 RepID=UPI0028F730EB|nr:glycoside hydrolase family 16 protein [Umezawaea sp. Da 62-37]WNV91676.1 glycoside hydrolase family 16 protein [Umezawaea sp. Da 62-37]
MRRDRLAKAVAASLLLLTSAACAEQSQPAGQQHGDDGWQVAWRDDFTGGEGGQPNPDDWIVDTGTGYPGGASNWGTGEIQTYTADPANLALDGEGNLRITPRRDSAGRWTSARIETKRADFKAPDGGVLRVEGRVRMPDATGPAGLGYWSAFWALGSPYRGDLWNWPGIGEVEFMENVNGLDRVWGLLHCGTAQGGPCDESNGIGGSTACPDQPCQAAFHTYRFEWDRSAAPEQLRWYVDGRQYTTVGQDRVDAANWARMTSHAGYFLLLNVAIGGGFPNGVAKVDTPTPATEPDRPMVVDYVSVSTKPRA